MITREGKRVSRMYTCECRQGDKIIQKQRGACFLCAIPNDENDGLEQTVGGLMRQHGERGVVYQAYTKRVTVRCIFVFGIKVPSYSIPTHRAKQITKKHSTIHNPQARGNPDVFIYLFLRSDRASSAASLVGRVGRRGFTRQRGPTHTKIAL